MKVTIKNIADGEFVVRRIARERLWEIQRPHFVRPQLLRDGFVKVRRNQ